VSGYLAGKVWQSDLSGTLKPLAAALADIANDDGTSIYPTIEYLAWLLGKSERAVQHNMSTLRAEGIIVPTCHAECAEYPGRSHRMGEPVHYQLVAAALPARPEWRSQRKEGGADIAPPQGKGGAENDTKGVKLAAPDPPVDPDQDTRQINKTRAREDEKPRTPKRITVVDDAFREEMVAKYAHVASRERVMEEIDDAIGHKAILKRIDHKAYVRNWLGRKQDWTAQRARGSAAAAPGRSAARSAGVARTGAVRGATGGHGFSYEPVTAGEDDDEIPW